MADRLPDLGVDHADEEPNSGPRGVPRWVIRFWLVALALVVLLALHLVVGGAWVHHGP